MAWRGIPASWRGIPARGEARGARVRAARRARMPAHYPVLQHVIGAAAGVGDATMPVVEDVRGAWDRSLALTKRALDREPASFSLRAQQLFPRLGLGSFGVLKTQ